MFQFDREAVVVGLHLQLLKSPLICGMFKGIKFFGALLEIFELPLSVLEAVMDFSHLSGVCFAFQL